MTSETLSLQATHEAFARHTVNRAGEALTPDDWAAAADLFASDARYYDCTYGWHEGREPIRKFLHDSIVGLEQWRFDIVWTMVDPGRVVVHLDNRPPGLRRDGTPIKFRSVTSILYNADGLIAEQLDIYNVPSAIRVAIESKWALLMGRRGTT